MPVLDWTRTSLDFEMKDGSRALRYESIALAAFDLYILKRFGAKKDYSKEQQIKAKIYLDALLEEEKTKLIKNIIAGFPGTKEGYTLEQFKIILNTYNEIDANKLKEQLLKDKKKCLLLTDKYELGG